MEALGALGTNFGLLDWVIVACYMLLTLVIGIYARGYVANMADYVVAARSLRSFLGVATMIGTELGLITVMYSAQKGFTGGFAAFHIALAAGVITLLVGITGFIVAPLRRLGVMTIPEFYELRFGRGLRIFGGAILALAGILNMGLFLKAGAVFVTALTGLRDPVYVNIVMTVMIVLVVAYTMLGGMISVIITDYVQFVLLSAGLLIACGIAATKVGWHNLVDSVLVVHGQAGFDPLDWQGFGPTYIVWQVLIAGLVSCAIWQPPVLRACAAENEQVVKRLYMLSSIGFLIRFMIPQFLGICALAYFWHHELARQIFFSEGKIVPSSDLTMAAMPVLLSQIIPTGLLGLIAAGMLAAFMSTHDSYLLCWASVIVQDVVAPLSPTGLSTKLRLALARLLVLLIAVFLLVWSLWYPLQQDLWDYMAVSGAIYSIGAMVVLTAGLYWPRASKAGAWTAICLGLLAVLGLGPVKNAVGLAQLEQKFNIVIDSEDVGVAVTLLAAVCMVVVSLLLPDRKKPAVLTDNATQAEHV